MALECRLLNIVIDILTVSIFFIACFSADYEVGMPEF